MNPFVNRLRTVSIFPVNTLYVTVDTTTTVVTYGICPKIWKALPCEGFILLNVTNTAPATAAATYLVNIDTSLTLTQANSITTSSTNGRALLNGAGDQMTNAEITAGNRYLVYYNKNQGIFQVVNHIPATT
jgi:hypothetical protein